MENTSFSTNTVVSKLCLLITNSIGVTAQEVEKVLSNIANTDSEDYKPTNYNGLITLLLKNAWKQSKKIKELPK